jgi:hypothetical protein
VLIHPQRESLEDGARYPAEHYVMVDDKLRILTAIKKYWGDRVTTVFPRQGQFAYDPQVLLLPQPTSPSIALALFWKWIAQSARDITNAAAGAV